MDLPTRIERVLMPSGVNTTRGAILLVAAWKDSVIFILQTGDRSLILITVVTGVFLWTLFFIGVLHGTVWPTLHTRAGVLLLNFRMDFPLMQFFSL